jgi:hypothetical protein
MRARHVYRFGSDLSEEPASYRAWREGASPSVKVSSLAPRQPLLTPSRTCSTPVKKKVLQPRLPFCPRDILSFLLWGRTAAS